MKLSEGIKSAIKIAKYVALGIGAIGTALVKVEEVGKEGVTSTNSIPILFIFVGFIVAIITSILEDVKEKTDEENKMKAALAEQQRLNEESKKLHHQLSRLMNPIDDFVIEVEFNLPVNQSAFKDWVMITRKGERLDTVGYSGEIVVTEASEGEKSYLRFLLQAAFSLWFYPKLGIKDTNEYYELGYSVFLNVEAHPLPINTRIGLRARRFVKFNRLSVAITDRVNYGSRISYRNSSIVSFEDLIGLDVFFTGNEAFKKLEAEVHSLRLISKTGLTLTAHAFESVDHAMVRANLGNMS